MGGEGSGYMGAKQCYSDACNEENDEKRLELLKQAQSYAKDAYGSEPKSADVLSTLCSVTNALVEESPSTDDKAKYEHELKATHIFYPVKRLQPKYDHSTTEYLDKAIEVSPCNCEFLDMRARLEYKFSMMDNRERRSVGRLHEARLDQALQDFCTLDKLTPNVTEYTFFIGKIYDAMEDHENARIYLNKVLELSTGPECEFANEAKQILNGSAYPVHNDAEEDYD